VLDADVARLSPYMRRHTDLLGARRALRDPDAPDND